MEKSIPELKAEFVCVCVCVLEREEKQQFLRYTRNANLLSIKDFKFAELLTKTSFSFTLERPS